MRSRTTRLGYSISEAGTEIYNVENIIIDSNLNSSCITVQIKLLRELLDKFSSLFSNDPGRTDLKDHDIVLLEYKYVTMKIYRLSFRQMEILRKEIKRMLELNIIVRGNQISPLL